MTTERNIDAPMRGWMKSSTFHRDFAYVWLRAIGSKPAAALWEVYVAGPESGPDSANYRTELNRPLVD
jgi:hypothetical protein